MPFKVYAQNEKYCVFSLNADGTRKNKKGCFNSKDEARRQQMALYAAVPDEKALYTEEDPEECPMDDPLCEDENMDEEKACKDDEMKAITKRRGNELHPASHYLVVGDPLHPSTWHLRVYNAEGNLDHSLMGAAHAALVGGGFRGQAYQGPDKDAAIAKLKKLYAQEDMDWDMVGKAEYFVTDENNALKALSITEDEMRVGNYLMLFDGNDLESFQYPSHEPVKPNPDGSLGERFSKSVDISSDYLDADNLAVDWEHGRDPDGMGNDKDAILGRVDAKSIRRTDLGIWGERVLNRRHRYMQWIEPLIKAGLVGSSTEPVQKSVEKTPDGTITRWGLKRDTLSVTPTDPRMMTDQNILRALKALDLMPVDPPQDNSSESVAGAVKAKEAQTSKIPKTQETQKMTTPLQTILASDMTPEAKEQLINELNKATQVPDVSKAIKEGVETALKAKGFGEREVAETPSTPRPVYNQGAPVVEEATGREDYFKSVYIARYGTEDAAKAAIMADVAGTNYRQNLLDQDHAFARYLRLGTEGLSATQQKALKTQIFPVEDIMSFVYEKGMSVEEMKATQVEAQGSLGGFAVPPARQSEWIKRMRGLTAVRAAGATVVTLANSNSAEFMEYTGGNDQYVGAIRGAWTSEGGTPSAKNFSIGTINVPVHVYSYRVKFSQSLVEDAASLITLLEGDIVETLAIDEDNAFLTGDGVKKPLGLLPDGANFWGLTEVNSGAAAALEADGIKLLKRGVASQYRQNAVFIGNSDTYGDIELLQDGAGLYTFPDLSDTDRLLGRRTFESEAMPDVAANAFPLIFGNMRGYGIVERLGMTIERFHDAYTGVNQTWFDVRRRIGGRILYPWMFAIQKVAA